jgi:hypothetical protein
MQTNFADMVGATEPLIAAGILAGAAQAELTYELDSLTPGLNEATGPEAEASAFAGTGFPDICGWVQSGPAEASVASAGPISTFFGSCVTQEPVAASAMGPTYIFPCF